MVDSGRKPLSAAEIQLLRELFPALPGDYLDYLQDVGWGEAENGRMIYSGPIDPREVYGDKRARSSILLLGDDFQGYCFGYDVVRRTYGEMTDSGAWEPWPPDRGFNDYVRDPDSD